MSVTASSIAALNTSLYGPASSRRDPLTAAEDALVLTWRARGLGWDACAKMVGRSTPDVRAHCDVDYQRPYSPARPVVEPPQAKAEGPAPRARAGGRRAVVSPSRRAILAAIKRGVTKAKDIADAADIDRDVVSSQLNGMHGLGWVTQTGGSWNQGWEWAVAPAGERALQMDGSHA